MAAGRNQVEKPASAALSLDAIAAAVRSASTMCGAATVGRAAVGRQRDAARGAVNDVRADPQTAAFIRRLHNSVHQARQSMRL